MKIFQQTLASNAAITCMYNRDQFKSAGKWFEEWYKANLEKQQQLYSETQLCMRRGIDCSTQAIVDDSFNLTLMLCCGTC